MELFNLTPFVAERFVFLDSTGLEVLLIVVKGTFAWEHGRAIAAPAQEPVTLADAYRGEPARTSVRLASDLVPFKPATDVLLAGFAYPQRRSQTEGRVALRLGKLAKEVRVIGDRVWGRTLGVSSISSPQPFQRIELTYERAFGGSDDSNPDIPERCEENPVGRGFRAARSKRPLEGTPLPNLEHPAQPVRAPSDRPPPQGFGPVAPHWRPRARHAGTYDTDWVRETLPFLPADFDDRYYLVAPPDQRHDPYVRGGEPVRIEGATPEGIWELAIPQVRPGLIVKVGGKKETPACACDTVSLNCEQKLLTLVWRARLVVQGRVPHVQWIKVRQEGDPYVG